MVGRDERRPGNGETVDGTARVMSSCPRAFVSLIYSDNEVCRFVDTATVPAVNALTDQRHPLQSIADPITLTEHSGRLRRPRVAILRAGDNVAHSPMEAVTPVGAEITVAIPETFRPDAEVVARAKAMAETAGGGVRLIHEPGDAAADANASYTDASLSMGGSEAERATRLCTVARYAVDQHILSLARPRATFMHCLPDHPGADVTAELVDRPQSAVLDQPEDRLQTAAAVLLVLSDGTLGGNREGYLCW